GQIPTNKSNVDSLLALTQWAWTFDPAVGMINAIKASGYLNAVRNAELRNLIASFEDLSRDTREEDLIVQNIIIKKYVPLVSKYVSMVQRTKYLGDIYVAIDSTRTAPNYKGLFNDREFESLLAYLYTWRADGKMEGENFLKLIVKFINNIEEELENRV
ncbi:MAG: hypothetical protein R3213_11320, partial [Flavobacteriaceae bacterium]|nr:hypothetical protein [Flavobacteriaceae bacterium]